MDPVPPFSLSDVEPLLPQSLRDEMHPIQRENLQLLVSLIQSRLSSRQLKWRNEELMNGGAMSSQSVDHGLQDALALCVAELVALMVSWQRQVELEKEPGQKQQVEYETWMTWHRLWRFRSLRAHLFLFEKDDCVR